MIGVYSPTRANLPREAKLYSQRVDSFIRKYSSASPVIRRNPSTTISGSIWTPVDRMLEDAEILDLKKRALLKRSESLYLKDGEMLRETLESSQERIDQVLCRFHSECLSPTRKKTIAKHCSFNPEVFQIKEFQIVYNELEEVTAEVLQSSPSVNLERLSNLDLEWRAFISRIKELNNKAGEMFFNQMKEPRIWGSDLLNAESARIELWIKAEEQILRIKQHSEGC